jgi:hypothetical protein
VPKKNQTFGHVKRRLGVLIVKRLNPFNARSFHFDGRFSGGDCRSAFNCSPLLYTKDIKLKLDGLSKAIMSKGLKDKS